MIKSNLQPWQPGISGNPNGRPKGSRNVKKVIQDLLNDSNVVANMNLTIPRGTETPLEAIFYTLLEKAIRGDVRASEVLLKHSVDKDMPVIEGGFFSQTKLVIQVVNADGSSRDDISEVREGNRPDTDSADSSTIYGIT